MNLEQGVIVAVLAHAGATIWWASKTSTMLANVVSELKVMNDKMSKEDGKLEARIDGAFKRIDEDRHRIVALEFAAGKFDKKREEF